MIQWGLIWPPRRIWLLNCDYVAGQTKKGRTLTDAAFCFVV
jgi:hypothetical protein